MQSQVFRLKSFVMVLNFSISMVFYGNSYVGYVLICT